MIVLGLTGSIGMGKSKAAAMFARLRVPVFDSDAAVRDALSPKGAGFEVVAVTYPDCWNAKKRLIDKQKLAALIFDDPKSRAQLEAILHPIVWHAQKIFLRNAQRMGAKIVVFDIPLLFETGAQARVDYTLCVTAPNAIQRQRVLARRDMTEEKFEKILATQMPDSQKRARADFVIPTGLGYAATYRALKNVLKSVKKDAAHA